MASVGRTIGGLLVNSDVMSYQTLELYISLKRVLGEKDSMR